MTQPLSAQLQNAPRSFDTNNFEASFANLRLISSY